MVITPSGVRGQFVITSLTPIEPGNARELSTEESVMANLKKSENVVRNTILWSMLIRGKASWRRGGIMVCALDSGSSGLDSSPGRGYCVAWVPANLMSAGGNPTMY